MEKLLQITTSTGPQTISVSSIAYVERASAVLTNIWLKGARTDFDGGAFTGFLVIVHPSDAAAANTVAASIVNKMVQALQEDWKKVLYPVSFDVAITSVTYT